MGNYSTTCNLAPVTFVMYNTPMQPQDDQQTHNTQNKDHVTVAGLEFEGTNASALESAFASELQDIPSVPKTNTTNTAGTDFKDKVAQIKHKQEDWTKEETVLKSDIEQKIQQLKTLKKSIEDEITNLKTLEQKKATLDNEIKKIEELENAQKNVEEEINNLIISQ